MKYQVLFTHQIGGVWAYHETLEDAQRHINLLTAMTPGQTHWSLLEDKREISSKKKNRGV